MNTPSIQPSPRHLITPRLLILIAFVAGAALAWRALPHIVPTLAATVQGDSVMAYWFISRAAGVVSYSLFVMTMLMGLLASTRTAQQWGVAPTMLALHEFTSILGLSMGALHAVILWADKHIHYTVWQVLVPFASSQFKPVAVGLGQVGFYALAVVWVSFYVRSRIGAAKWRWLHYATFVAFAMVTLHGIMAGSDALNPYMLGLYVVTGLAVITMVALRMVRMVTA